MANLAKAALSIAVTSLGLLISIPSLMADELGLQFTSKDPDVLDGYGVFYVNDTSIYSGSGVFNDFGSPGTTYTFNSVSSGSIFAYEGYIYADFTSNNKSSDYDISLATSFSSGGKFGNQVEAIITDHGFQKIDTIGYFDTPVISVTEPGSSGGGSSGNAPSPEVNTIVGLLVVGCTVAFLRRKRSGSLV